MVQILVRTPERYRAAGVEGEWVREGWARGPRLGHVGGEVGQVGGGWAKGLKLGYVGGGPDGRVK